MITNPLFAPQNQRAQYSQGMPSSLAYALMPTDNFAQKRADSAAAVQYQSMLMGLADQAAAEKEKSLLETQKSLELIDNQAILGPDMRRLNQSLTEKWRANMEDEIVNKYGGDIVRWKRERQPYHVMVHNRELAQHPDFQRALENKTNYAQAQEAKAKGKLLVGDFDSEWANYVSGKTNVLNYRGSYDAPKNGFDYFDKTAHPTNPYGVNGKPVGVSQDDLYAHLMSQGLSGSQAEDYMQKIGYQSGSRFWKREQQDPWDAQKQAYQEAMDQKKFNAARSDEAWNRRIDSARLGLEGQRVQIARDKASEGTTNGVPTILNEVYAPPAKPGKASYKTPDGQVIASKPGATGSTGVALIRAAGIDPQMTQSNPKVSTDKKDTRRLYKSNVFELHSTDFSQKYHTRMNEGGAPVPFLFDNVDPTTIYYYGDKPFLHGVARINGKPRKVAIPIQDNELTRGELVDEGGIYSGKSKRTQYFESQQEPASKRRSSVAADADNF